MIKTVFLTSRPAFLFLSFSVVVLGSSVAVFQGAEWSTGLFLLVLSGALLAHSAVNMLNEYQDFQSGLDSQTVRTPFSGGSGALPNNPAAAPYVFKALLAIMALLILLGGYFIGSKGWGILPLGLLGIVLIVTYTALLTRLPWLCLISPGLAFGPIMVLGTYYIWTSELSWLAFSVSLLPFFLVNNLLLLNQFPDVAADKTVGRLNILMLLGNLAASRIFIGFVFLAYLSLLASLWLLNFPAPMWLGFTTLLLALPMSKMVWRHYQNLEKLMPALAMNVIINLLTPLLVAIGLIWLI